MQAYVCRHWHRASSFIFFFRPCLDNRIGIASERLSLAVSPGASERRQAWELLRQICAQFCSPNMQNSHPNETALCQSSPAQAADPLVTQRTDKNTTQHTHLHSFVVRIRITFSISNKKIRNRYRMATFGRSIGLEAGSGYPCHDSICLKPPSPDSLSAQLSAKHRSTVTSQELQIMLLRYAKISSCARVVEEVDRTSTHKSRYPRFVSPCLCDTKS